MTVNSTQFTTDIGCISSLLKVKINQTNKTAFNQNKIKKKNRNFFSRFFKNQTHFQDTTFSKYRKHTN